MAARLPKLTVFFDMSVIIDGGGDFGAEKPIRINGQSLQENTGISDAKYYSSSMVHSALPGLWLQRTRFRIRIMRWS